MYFMFFKNQIMRVERLDGKVKIPGYGSGGMSAAAPLASSGEEERTSSTSEAASPSSSPCLRASKLSPDQRGYVVSCVKLTNTVVKRRQ